jgi:hypothetical protein
MNKPLWKKLLDERQQKELEFAELYAAEFHHGTDGHSRLMLLAKLSELLTRIEMEGIVIEERIANDPT